MAVISLGPKSRAGFMAKAVCIPNAAPTPTMTKKMTRGTSPSGGGLFRLSVTAKTTMRRIAVQRAYYSVKELVRDTVVFRWYCEWSVPR